MKKISAFLAFFLLFMICSGFSMPVFSETSDPVGVKLQAFLEQWNEQLKENEEYGLFIHTGIFMKIGIMGCIVNGPGEMADADYGYVGAGRGKISLYRQKECVEKNIPEDEAVEHLLKLIKEDQQAKNENL